MAGMDENELAQNIFEAGKRLEHPPQSKDDLVQALEVNFHLEKNKQKNICQGLSMIFSQNSRSFDLCTVFCLEI